MRRADDADLDTRGAACGSRRIKIAAAVALLALVGAGCSSGHGSGSPDELRVVVSAPVASQPWIASAIERGARLAVDEINAHGGAKVGGTERKLSVQVLDNGGSPATATANARTAVSEHAAALLIDGVAPRPSPRSPTPRTCRCSRASTAPTR